MDWCKNRLKNSSFQEYLESKVNILLAGPLKERDQYAKKKQLSLSVRGLDI